MKKKGIKNNTKKRNAKLKRHLEKNKTTNSRKYLMRTNKVGIKSKK